MAIKLDEIQTQILTQFQMPQRGWIPFWSWSGDPQKLVTFTEQLVLLNKKIGEITAEAKPEEIAPIRTLALQTYKKVQDIHLNFHEVKSQLSGENAETLRKTAKIFASEVRRVFALNENLFQTTQFANLVDQIQKNPSLTQIFLGTHQGELTISETHCQRVPHLLKAIKDNLNDDQIAVRLTTEELVNLNTLLSTLLVHYGLSPQNGIIRYAEILSYLKEMRDQVKTLIQAKDDEELKSAILDAGITHQERIKQRFRDSYLSSFLDTPTHLQAGLAMLKEYKRKSALYCELLGSIKEDKMVELDLLQRHQIKPLDIDATDEKAVNLYLDSSNPESLELLLVCKRGNTSLIHWDYTQGNHFRMQTEGHSGALGLATEMLKEHHLQIARLKATASTETIEGIETLPITIIGYGMNGMIAQAIGHSLAGASPDRSIRSFSLAGAEFIHRDWAFQFKKPNHQSINLVSEQDRNTHQSAFSKWMSPLEHVVHTIPLYNRCTQRTTDLLGHGIENYLLHVEPTIEKSILLLTLYQEVSEWITNLQPIGRAEIPTGAKLKELLKPTK